METAAVSPANSATELLRRLLRAEMASGSSCFSLQQCFDFAEEPRQLDGFGIVVVAAGLAGLLCCRRRAPGCCSRGCAARSRFAAGRASVPAPRPSAWSGAWSPHPRGLRRGLSVGAASSGTALALYPAFFTPSTSFIFCYYL